ncbi:tryptophan 2,3-dioxygenase [Nocardia transvalensis]|uniref:Tryptophan 2,3-dioxygenase n=1 Tax=Nocardia transvalensis TaxID=37333 RepID=A0A7W9PF60_9NOCA|nr:hypothetical protein [Nocardia transvalensis]MBB5914770.1 tryptophan 2,3-dioxygenase [Nocardia transvalensis]
MDVGQSTATGLYQQAVAGTFKMEPGAAQKCAEIYQRFAESVDKMITDSYHLQRLDGFGTFDSALALQQGFEQKGLKMIEALTGLEEASLKMAAAYLQAGGHIEDAESMNNAAIKVAGERLPK